MAYAALNKTGCEERKGNVKLRLDFYLDAEDPRYSDRYLYLVDVTSAEYLAGYPGEVDKDGNPVDQEDYDNWLNAVPHIWENTPFHCHFVYLDANVTVDDIKAEIAFHLPNFYKAFQERRDEANGGMRHGWAVEKRVRPTDYSKDAQRVSECQAKVDELTEFSYKPKAEKGKEYPATAIDIGPGATDRTAGKSSATIIDKDNSANDTGTIDTFEIWANVLMDETNKVGTFYGVGTDYTNRDGESIGAVAIGAKRTFTGLSIDVTTGDFAGLYFSAGKVEYDFSGGSDIYTLAGDQFGTGEQTYALLSSDAISIYGTGETALGEATIDLEVALTASVARVHASVRSISVELTLSPTVSRALAIVRSIPLELSAVASVARSRNRTYSIDVALSGFITIVTRGAAEIVVSCGLVVSTSTTMVKAWVRSLTDNLTVSTTISKARGWTETMAANLNVTAAISRVVTFGRATAPSLKSISSFSALWSGVTDTLVTIATSLTVATSIAYQWAAKRTVSPSLTLTAAISRAVTTTRSVSASITLAVSFLINEAVGRALKVITTVSHVFSMKTVATHVRKIITREGD